VQTNKRHEDAKAKGREHEVEPTASDADASAPRGKLSAKAYDEALAKLHVELVKRARLNIISHLLAKIPYGDAPREKVKLPKRQKAGDHAAPDYPFKFVEERY
jgi:hypothetical protein